MSGEPRGVVDDGIPTGAEWRLAYWDDGWWPKFETPGVKRRFRRQTWVSLWGRDRIEGAVADGRIP